VLFGLAVTAYVDGLRRPSGIVSVRIGVRQMVVGITVAPVFVYTMGRLSQPGILVLGFPHGV